ncbi:DUF4258 domain-containing protein [Limnoraphis robusta]|uniref:DUF4258 domain-containing protein n=1 Tax=Limnoraphis robusta CS-951 TaxID=1637645 RepID=A0A0F5YA97_9CYAN|nr:DUF4258 domain-containing protein [Limnoraphis robusta]KKD35886.1 hypothetical protein WN50_22975 [Limnoraphis robusta CS-951]MEA5499716.1 DUF4258 domain-containing protein [Limnoraphis robusta BA-68 BA1]MEB3283230.1 DUF4258 domain-containing protein [Lyngbya sp.]
MKILTDYQGRSVRLTEERLTHILQHPELVNMEDEIEITLQNPEQVRRSRTDETVLISYRYYTGTLVGDKWLCVVVKYLENDAFVLTAYFTDQVKKGEQLWPQP